MTMTYEELKETEPIDDWMACDMSVFGGRSTASAASAQCREPFGSTDEPHADPPVDSPARSIKGPADYAARLWSMVATFVANEWRIRGDMRELRSMSDAMLKDIGLTREDIES
ncbi:MAG: DUF1127 domain-containing protein [Rhizobiales bacterium]|nr:DUF1127 domain-containing protein [Hyphomicrobiales bacterium]